MLANLLKQFFDLTHSSSCLLPGEKKRDNASFSYLMLSYFQYLLNIIPLLKMQLFIQF